MEIQQVIGFAPKNISFYQRAFTHPSLQKKDKFENPLNYERLEFLGDAVLGAVMAAYLFKELPESDEGNLTQMRSKIVSRQALNQLGKEFGLLNFLEKEGHNGGLGENIHGNLFEALVGAIYMDKGFRACQKFIFEKVINEYVDINRLEGKITSYKSYLIEWCQKEKRKFEFIDCKDSGRERIKHFSVKLLIDGKVIGKARCTSKKKAEEKAAKRAYFALQDEIDQ